MTTKRAFTTTAAVQDQLGFSTPDGTIGFLRRHRLHPLRVGRRLLWRTLAVDRLIGALAKGQRRSA